MRVKISHYFHCFLIGVLMAQGFSVGFVPATVAHAAVNLNEPEPTRDAIMNLLTNAPEERSFWLCAHFDNTKSWLNNVLGGIVTQDYAHLAPRYYRGDHGGGPMVVPVWENNHVFLNDIESMARVTEMMAYKECVLDPVAHALKSFLVDEITNDILEWVSVGFDGGPMFLNSPLYYGKEASYQALDVLLNEEDIYGMYIEDHFSTPFASDVVQEFERSAMQPKYHQVPEYSKYGSTIEPGVYNALAVDATPVDGYFVRARALLKEGNNPISASYNIKEMASSRINQVLDNEKTLAAYGNGILSPRCDISNSSEPYFTVCTPGAIVMSQIDDWLGGSLGQLENAAESGAILNEGYARIVERILIPNTSDVEHGLLAGASWRTSDANNPFSYSDPLRQYEQHDAPGGLVWDRSDGERFNQFWSNPPPPPEEFITPSAGAPSGWVGPWPPEDSYEPGPAPSPAPGPAPSPAPGPTTTITPPSSGSPAPDGWPTSEPWPPTATADEWICQWEWNVVTEEWYAQCCLWGICISVGS